MNAGKRTLAGRPLRAQEPVNQGPFARRFSRSSAASEGGVVLGSRKYMAAVVKWNTQSTYFRCRNRGPKPLSTPIHFIPPGMRALACRPRAYSVRFRVL